MLNTIELGCSVPTRVRSLFTCDIFLSYAPCVCRYNKREIRKEQNVPGCASIVFLKISQKIQNIVILQGLETS